MEEKTITPQESMEIITQMIETSKQRMRLPDLRLSMMWAILTIVCALVVLVDALIDYTPWINLIWFAIPAIGIPVTIAAAKKSCAGNTPKTPIDVISDGIWRTVGIIAVLLSVICVAFNIAGHPEAWLAMFFFAFIVVGFGSAMTGIVLKEKSYCFGGVFSILAGFLLVVLAVCRIPLLIVWVLPLYILCFLLMFVVPAIIISKKLKAGKQ